MNPPLARGACLRRGFFLYQMPPPQARRTLTEKKNNGMMKEIEKSWAFQRPANAAPLFFKLFDGGMSLRQ